MVAVMIDSPVAQPLGDARRWAAGTPTGTEAVPASYLRRRIVLAVVAVVCVWGFVSAAHALVAAVVPSVESSGPAVIESAASFSGVTVSAELVIVQPGDTLWTVARQLQPTGDVRPLVQRLSELNGGASLQVGQALRLP